MSDLTYAYPFDPTGRAASNKIPAERHTISVRGLDEYVFIMPRHAPFFQEGLIVTHYPSGRILDEGVDYVLGHKFEAASLSTATPIFGSISFYDRTLTGTIEISYNTVGGMWTIDEQEIARILANALINPRITTWEQVVDVRQTFPPINHDFNVVDLIGMSEVQEAVLAIRDAVMAGNRLIEDEDGQIITDPNATLHETDYDNPHQTTKAQVGLSEVQNYPMATSSDITDLTNSNAYVSPKDLGTFLSRHVVNIFDNHLLDKNNPHEVNKVQVGLGNVENYPVASSSQVIGMQDNESYLTPLSLYYYHSTYGGSLTNHVDDTNNPHGVDAEQVGLGNVSNFRTSNEADAIQGTRSDLFITPAGVSAFVRNYVGDNQFINDLRNHLTDTNNPHNVTAQQIGAATEADVASALGSLETRLTDDISNRVNAMTNERIVPIESRLGILETTVTDQTGRLETVEAAIENVDLSFRSEDYLTKVETLNHFETITSSIDDNLWLLDHNSYPVFSVGVPGINLTTEVVLSGFMRNGELCVALDNNQVYLGTPDSMSLVYTHTTTIKTVLKLGHLILIDTDLNAYVIDGGVATLFGSLPSDYTQYTNTESVAYFECDTNMVKLREVNSAYTLDVITSDPVGGNSFRISGEDLYYVMGDVYKYDSLLGTVSLIKPIFTVNETEYVYAALDIHENTLYVVSSDGRLRICEMDGTELESYDFLEVDILRVSDIIVSASDDGKVYRHLKVGGNSKQLFNDFVMEGSVLDVSGTSILAISPSNEVVLTYIE